MRKMVVLGLRVLALAAVLMILLGVCAQVTGVARAGPAAPPPDPARAALAPLPFCLLASAVLGWLILRSALYGWPLAAAVFAAHYGLGTVMFQVESLVFLPRQLPPGFLPRLFAMGALVALLFAPVRSSNFVFGCLVGVAFARRR